MLGKEIDLTRDVGNDLDLDVVVLARLGAVRCDGAPERYARSAGTLGPRAEADGNDGRDGNQYDQLSTPSAEPPDLSFPPLMLPAT